MHSVISKVLFNKNMFIISNIITVSSENSKKVVNLLKSIFMFFPIIENIMNIMAEARNI